MYFYTVHEVLPGLLIFGVGFLLLGLAAAALLVLWNAAKHLTQWLRRSRSHFAFLLARWKEEMPGAEMRPRLALASVRAWRARRGAQSEPEDKWS